MNDEATVHYQSIIDQFTLGLRLLNETFGECGRPRVAWQIDPFGHSRDMASMFAQMGFDGLFFARLDYEDKIERLSTKVGEMVWHGSSTLGESSDLFTGILYNHYSPPPGFCFDVLCSDEPIIDGKHSPENNVNRKLDTLFNYLKTMSDLYRTNNLLIPMGDDFTYQDANMWYKNLDKLIKYANHRQQNGSDFNLFYSTPSCYLKALHEANIEWPTKSEDFFPYASDETSFWTGYFTSRPNIKRYERVGNHFLQICKQLTASTPDHKPFLIANLEALQEVMGVMQHHDAITGTEKRVVALDYAKQLSEGIGGCSKNIESILNNFVIKAGGFLPKFEFESCLNLNISNCEISEKEDKFMVTVYNPLQLSTQYIRIPIQDVEYIVRDSQGILIPSQNVPIPEPVRNLPFRFAVSQKELVFAANDVPQNGFKSYFIELDTENPHNFVPEVTIIHRTKRQNINEIIIGNENVEVMFNKNGILTNISANGIDIGIRQEFFYYNGAAGNNMEHSNRSSGAYVFRPNGTEHLISDDIQIKVFRGQEVEEVHQIFNEWVSQVVRVYRTESFVEFEWMIGPIPVNDRIGKEIITRYSSDINSDGVFYTDSNGRETLKRVRNQRENFTPTMREKIAGNYYPVTTKIAIEDDKARLAILVDRAQGGSSIYDGSIELMLHRRLIHDDGFGVDEALNEMEFGGGIVARGKHYLSLGRVKSDIKLHERALQLEKLLPFWTFFSELRGFTYDEWQNSFIHERSIWSIPVPPFIHLMTIEPVGQNQLLLRFENTLEESDDSDSTPINFNIAKLLEHYGDATVRETTLGGNMWKADMKRLKFNIEEKGNIEDIEEYEVQNEIPDITLKPMQIATLIITFQ